MELAHRIAGLSTLNVLPAARVPNAARQDCTAWVTACRRLHLRTRLRAVRPARARGRMADARERRLRGLGLRFQAAAADAAAALMGALEQRAAPQRDAAAPEVRTVPPERDGAAAPAGVARAG